MWSRNGSSATPIVAHACGQASTERRLTSFTSRGGSALYTAQVTPQELITIVCPQIRDLGWAHFFVPQTAARGEELGLDLFTFYFLGRGGVLGDVEGGVVASAFGFFEPGLVAGMWSAGKEIVAPRDAGRAFLGCAADFGRATFADLPGVDALNAALDTVNDAADPIGLALYAAVRAEPLADDAPARVMQLVSVLREFRGSAHIVALRAVGLDVPTAHFLHRPGDVAMFGWPEATAREITDVERDKFAAAERITDEIVLPAYAALDAAGQVALVDGLAAMHAQLQPPTY